ncbi:MAG TPA: LacI family DNA-binding transcriptional regulator [Roseiarcus sp.]|nr:LacI family DNA-binding transcriptional regulator [Roseiarcus sp.]
MPAPRGHEERLPGRVTIVDVARQAGVSKSTVSLVLAGSGLVAPKTRERVQSAMEALGYVYHRGAASLRAASSDLVGLVISDLTNPFFAELAAGIEDALYRLGFTPILANTNEDPERQAQVLRSLREHHVAGIIMSPARGTDAWTFAQQWPESMPAVMTTRRLVGSPLPFVGPDNAKGTRLAVEHLLRLGHRSIAFLGGDRSTITQQERSSGWRDAFNAAGLAADAALVVEAPPTRAGGRIAVAKALSLPRPPTAALCYNDMVAIGATRELAVRGIAPGRDFAVIGFDDIAEAEYNAPPLTTISAGTREMGRRCAESLLGLIRREDSAGLSYAGEPRLIVRESCGANLKQRMAS